MVEKKIKKDFSKFKWDFFDLNKVFSVFVILCGVGGGPWYLQILIWK